MTYFHVRTDRRLSAEVVDALRDDIVDLLYLVRKTATTSMIDIQAGCNIRMGDGGAPCVYMEVKCAVMPRDEDIRAFSAAAATLFGEALGVELNRTYISFEQMPCCATGNALTGRR